MIFKQRFSDETYKELFGLEGKPFECVGTGRSKTGFYMLQKKGRI
jgi:hypothetical protein